MSEDTGTDLDDIVELVQRQMDLASVQTQGAADFRERVEKVRASATSTRGELGVTVTPSGRLTNVTLTHAAMRLQPQTLARLLVDTAEVAQLTASAQALRLAEETFGRSSALIERVRDEATSPSPALGARSSR